MTIKPPTKSDDTSTAANAGQSMTMATLTMATLMATALTNKTTTTSTSAQSEYKLKQQRLQIPNYIEAKEDCQEAEQIVN
jgi:hypothetical protein